MKEDNPPLRITFEKDSVKIWVRNNGYYVLEIPLEAWRRNALMKKISTYIKHHGREALAKLLSDFTRIFGRKIEPYQYSQAKSETKDQ